MFKYSPLPILCTNTYYSHTGQLYTSNDSKDDGVGFKWSKMVKQVP